MSRPLALVNIPDQFFVNNPNAGRVGNSLGDLVTYLLPNVLIFTGVVFFLLIIYYGFHYIQIAGQQRPPAEIAKTKATFTYAVTGFLLVISAYFILQILSTVTGVNFQNPNVT